MFLDILEKVFWGNTLQNWGISLLIIIVAIVLNMLIKLLNKHIIQKITSRTKNRLDDILFKMLEAPILLGVILFAIWIATSRLHVSTTVFNIISKSYEILVVLNVTWFFARVINAFIEEFLISREDDKTNKKIDIRFLPIIRRVVLVIVWTIGLVMALNNAGVKVGTLLGTLGVGGIAFALAAQDTIKNIFGGFTIFLDQPFRIGERIRIGEFDGFVEDIGIRSTRIRTLEKRIVTIPNYKIVDASIENISNEPKRKVVVKLGLTYDTSPEKMSEAISILKELPKQINHIDKREVVAVFSDFSSSSLLITFVYYITRGGDPMETSSQVNMEILKSFKKAGLVFAFPSQTIYLENAN